LSIVSPEFGFKSWVGRETAEKLLGQQLELRKLTPHCGAQVEGLDLSSSLDDKTVQVLLAALAEHGG